ncbi:hypothetical protein S40293_08246 [Stachybotrys chartarum IBT 40293]|nr:hypothetical protein S40293_08246 [Stachybotrys chartarum IBT 40293]
MPSYLLSPRQEASGDPLQHSQEDQSNHVFVTDEAAGTVNQLHRALSEPNPPQQLRQDEEKQLDTDFAELESYLRSDDGPSAWPAPAPLSVCFKSISTYGTKAGPESIKTVKDAIWRTLTFQDMYEATLKKLVSPEKIELGRPLIRDFSGVVRNGEMMLVLGNPGSGCSTFLRTIGGQHDSFLGVKGDLDYSGLSIHDVQKRYRSAVSYIPENDVHLPTLTVRQTLEFALKAKTPKRMLHEIPRFLDQFGRIFGMTHVMDTLVGNEFIRGVSGGERKRVSILESLASDASINCWDGSTRGLDAASALDYIRSLRIITNTGNRATVVSLYQASDAIYNLMDKLLLIDEGRMLYQGPASAAEAYFENLGYQRLPRQTMSDFLTSVTAGSYENVQEGAMQRVPRGAANLEQAFRTSKAFRAVEREIEQYEAEFPQSAIDSDSAHNAKYWEHQPKSRYVSSKSRYNTSFIRQAVLCTQRQYWQLLGHKTPFFTKIICVVVCAFLLGSMFYDMSDDTAGVYSRGGFCFYSAAILAWFQLAELEAAFFDRAVVSRQKGYAMTRPSAVVLGKVILDVPQILTQSALFSIIGYFLSGMRHDVGVFFAFLLSIFLSGFAFTAFYRAFGAVSPRLEVALRYCGLVMLIGIIFGGYVRSVERLIEDVPWVGWLAYITPVLYSFEIIIAFEFHNRDFPCTADSIIPAGPEYSDLEFQGCAYQGMSTGQLNLSGDEYIAQHFGFSYGNVARDFGILVLFTVALVAINMLIVEKVDWAQEGGKALEYARGRKEKDVPTANDEESVGRDQTPVTHKPSDDSAVDGNLLKAQSTFTWKDINYSVSHKGGEKQLLNKVSGYCEPGKLTALVGASGAGKSTLMTVLTQQATGKLSGEMKVDGQPLGLGFGRSIGYCQQMDIHVETSTVREAFEFSALLRQPSSVSRDEKLAYVNEVLSILQMTSFQDVAIRSLSLEQKKRTTIGVELCAKPSLLLFLDEPTSGLDGQGAMNIVRLLRRLADNGQAIICTIHQASQEQFEQFDRVLALQRGGRAYYFGDVGTRGKAVLDYFAQHGVHMPHDKNVADLLIEVTAQGNSHSLRDWCDIWEQSPEAAAVVQKIDDNAAVSGGTISQDPMNGNSTIYASSTMQQTYHLTRRTIIQYWRTPDYVYSRLYCSFFHALLNALAFLQLGNTESELQYRIFSCFLILMIVAEIINACAVMFDENRNIWLGREYPSRIYGWTAFTTAQVVAEIPYALIGGLLFYLIFYFIVGLPLGAPAGYTFLMIMLFYLFTTSWGQWIAALSSDAAMAANIMPFFVVMCEFFNGVLQPVSLMPPVWRYTMYYIGPFTYWIGGIAAMILSPIDVACHDSELSRFSPPPNNTCLEYSESWLSRVTGYLDNPDATSDCGYCQYASGEDYLSTISVELSDAWPYLAIFVLFTVTNYLSVYLWVYVKSVKNWLPW